MKIIIEDEDKAHEAFIRAYELYPIIQNKLRTESKRPAGTIHAEIDSFDCPDGLPNCRNCGDAQHLQSCRAKGHCPNCGINHGVAPNSVLKNNGYRVEE